MITVDEFVEKVKYPKLMKQIILKHYPNIVKNEITDNVLVKLLNIYDAKCYGVNHIKNIDSL